MPAANRSPRPPRAHALAAAALAVGLAACGRDELLQGLDETQANQVLVALDEAGVRAEKRRDDGGDAGWRVEVAAAESARARRVLADRELPRSRPPGFGEVFGKGSVVPSASEERALYLHALCGELARTIEAIDGVVEARVHLALPPQDPLRAEAPPPSRAAVLVKARPGARAALEPLAGGIQALVAGAVAGLDASAVAVVIAESGSAPRAAPATAARSRWPLVALAAAALVGSLALLVAPAVVRWAEAVLARRRGGA